MNVESNSRVYYSLTVFLGTVMTFAGIFVTLFLLDLHSRWIDFTAASFLWPLLYASVFCGSGAGVFAWIARRRPFDTSKTGAE